MTGAGLTDSELRRELQELGANIGPITVSTRGLYIKRLNKLKKSKETNSVEIAKVEKNLNENVASSVKGRKLRQRKPTPARKTFGFSTDESDGDDKGSDIVSKASVHGHNRDRKEVRDSVTTDARNRKSVHSKMKQSTNLRSTSLHGKQEANSSTVFISNGYSDDSDDSEIPANGSWIEVTNVDTSTGTSPVPIDSDSSRTLSRRSLWNRSPLHDGSSFSFNTPRLPSQNSSTGTESLDNSASNVTYPHSPKNLNLTHEKVDDAKAKVSDRDVFRRRVLSKTLNRNITNNANATEQLDHMRSSEITASHEQPKVSIFSKLVGLFKPAKKRDAENSVNTFTRSEAPVAGSWSLHCSMLLPICTIVFFAILGLLYVTMRSDGDGTVAEGTFISYSSEEDDINRTRAVVKGIYDIVGRAAGKKVCNYSDASSDLLPVNKIKSFIQVDDGYWNKALEMIRKHPEWELLLYKQEERSFLNEDDHVSDVAYMASKRPILPTLCRFRRAVEKVLLRVSMVVLGGLLIWLFIMYRQYRTKKQEEMRQKMYFMVEKILDALKTHHEASLNDETVDSFLPILHARDMIIRPQDRRKMAKVWEKAVKFISASESRIRVETQRVSGEDLRVWRWIQVISPSKRTPGRIWQGEAFDTNRSINTSNICPTPCLKIRNMFDPDVEKDADWNVQVQQSILEKCADNNEILSIVVEKTSKEGLVYLKCASCRGAGRAFRALHGSWFDGRLVTVKFIKLQRYHSRYPHTVDSNTPLRPNSSKPVSTFMPQSPNDFSTSTPLKMGS